MTKKKETMAVSMKSVRVIRLMHDYHGAPTGYKHIKPGIYQEDDPALLGQAEMLITNRHAEVISVTEVRDESEVDTEDTDEVPPVVDDEAPPADPSVE